MSLGLQDDGTVEVPPQAFPAGWYSGAPTPGELGPAILVGHVHYDDTDGCLRRSPAACDPATTSSYGARTGSRRCFRVTRVRHYAKDQFPTAKVYGNIDHAGLRLITCGGHDLISGRYEDNVIAFARGCVRP